MAVIYSLISVCIYLKNAIVLCNVINIQVHTNRQKTHNKNGNNTKEKKEISMRDYEKKEHGLFFSLVRSTKNK